MKTITLNTPTADNSGARRDAGESLSVGAAPEAITLARAQALVAVHSAVDATPPAPAKAKADK